MNIRLFYSGEAPPFDWPNDEEWEVFLPDGDPYEPEPLPGDFWIGDEPDDLERLAA